jgi:hypothetical protein
MQVFDILMQVVGGALLVLLAAVMIRRRLHREYPFFFAYVAFTLLTTIALFFIISNQETYFHVYWATEALNVTLAVLALHEAYYEVFYAFYSFRRFWMIFPGVVIMISAVCITHAMLQPPTGAPLITTVILSLGTAVSYVQAGLFVVFLVLVAALHVRWRRYPFDIALGFAVSTLGEWTAFALRSEFGNKFPHMTRYASPVAYICATLVWLWSFSGRLAPEPKMQWTQDVSPEQLLAQMKEYTRIMKKLLGKTK